MLFNSYLFLGLFLPVALAGFAVTSARGPRLAMGWLLTMSLVFYGWWTPAFLPVLLVSIGGNFLAARMILTGRPVLVAAITLNLAGLCWYKYLAATLGFFGVNLAAPMLPLGISFFTFTQIGYLLDCHARLEQRRSLLEYALFVTFFPHLIAGPILSAREIFPGFASWRLTSGNLAMGGGIFLIGLLKKTLLADPVSGLAGPGFVTPDSLTLWPAWQAALAWSLQLYFDFSGYSDMAVGLARMFGIAFPFNFDAPYRAGTVIDYWQRWHISLTRFLTNTIHAPLTLMLMRRRRARNDRSGPRSAGGFLTLIAFPILVTMGLAGIWHGAGLTFVIFGLLHAGFLIVNHAWRIWSPWRLHPAAAVPLTYLCVLSGAIIFRASSISGAGSLFAGMLGLHGIAGSIEPINLLWLTGLFAIIAGAPTTQTIMTPGVWRPSAYWATAMGAAATLGLLSVGGTGEFLYFQF